MQTSRGKSQRCYIVLEGGPEAPQHILQPRAYFGVRRSITLAQEGSTNEMAVNTVSTPNSWFTDLHLGKQKAAPFCEYRTDCYVRQ